jgi:hypothetical protein
MQVDRSRRLMFRPFQIGPTPLQDLKSHHDTAYSFLTNALDWEERGEKDLAADFYQRGIKEIKAALRVKTSDADK